MSCDRLRCATRVTAASVASLAAILLLQAEPARAGEVVSTTCMHGSGGTQTYHYGDAYANRYSSDYGDGFARGFSYTVPEGFGFRRGFADDRRGRFVVGSRDANGGGSVGGSDAGMSGGSSGGSSSGYGGGSSTSYGSNTCIEVRHELVNPNVIQVAPQSEAEYRAAAERDRLWTAHCKPVVKQDRNGIDRYAYAAAGCDYGRYE